MKKYFFPPQQLIITKREMIADYRRRGFYIGKNKVDREICDLIRKLSLMPREEVRGFSQKLKRDELNMIASYLPYNDLELDLSNLILALDYRFRNQFLDASYRAYQDTLGNQVYSKWMTKHLQEKKSYKVRASVPSGRLLKLFTTNKPISLIILKSKEMNLSFDDILTRYAVRSKSRLAGVINEELLIQATKQQYLNMNGIEIQNRSSRFTLIQLSKLLNNYLKVLEVSEFHKEFLDYIHRHYDTPNKKQSTLWQKVDEEQRRKFIKWLAIDQMETIFGTDERTRFWKRYLNTVKASFMNDEQGRLALDFGDIVIVDFKQNNNAVYAYHASDFYDVIIKEFRSKTNSHKRVKNKNLAIKSLRHIGNWQHKFMDKLRAWGIRQ